MTSGWHCPTRVVHETAGLASWLRSLGCGMAWVLVDEAVAGAEVTDRVDRAARRAGARSRVLVLRHDTGGTAESLGELDRQVSTATADPARTHAVVAVGGGFVMDQGKLLAVTHRSPEVMSRVTARQRSGLALLSADTARTLPLAAVATTLGTGAEVSSSAVIDLPRGRRLVVAEALRPDLAVVDPVGTATLPVELVAEGVLEALFRVVSMYVGDDRELPVEDGLTLALAECLVAAGHRVATARSTVGTAGDDLRLEIAKLSGLTQAGWLNVGRNRYAAKGWYLATELSWVMRCRKVTAIATLLPALWRVVGAGDHRWGAATRLNRLWAHVRSASPAGLPADPSAGVAALLDAWQVARAPGLRPEDRHEVARRSMRFWGSGLPMLGGLRAADIRALLDLVDEPCGPPVAIGRPDHHDPLPQPPLRRTTCTQEPDSCVGEPTEGLGNWEEER